MKKSFFTFVLIAFCAFGAFAQGISGGLKVGANFANQKFDADGLDISPDSRTSLHAGVYAKIMISDMFGIQPELIYNSVGTKFDISGADAVSKINYLSLPIMFRYNPVPVFNIHAGPQFGFLLSAEEEFNGNTSDSKDGYKGLDLGAGIGVGVDLPMGLGISARYVLGLANILDDEDADFSDVKVTNNVIQLSVSYRLFGE